MGSKVPAMLASGRSRRTLEFIGSKSSLSTVSPHQHSPGLHLPRTQCLLNSPFYFFVLLFMKQFLRIYFMPGASERAGETKPFPFSEKGRYYTIGAMQAQHHERKRKVGEGLEEDRREEAMQDRGPKESHAGPRQEEQQVQASCQKSSLLLNIP